MPNNDVIIIIGFSIENYQPAPQENDTPIINTRYWSTGDLLEIFWRFTF